MLFVSYENDCQIIVFSLNLSVAIKIKLLKHYLKFSLTESNNTIRKMTGKVTEGVLGVIFTVGSVIRVKYICKTL